MAACCFTSWGWSNSAASFPLHLARISSPKLSMRLDRSLCVPERPNKPFTTKVLASTRSQADCLSQRSQQTRRWGRRPVFGRWSRPWRGASVAHWCQPQRWSSGRPQTCFSSASETPRIHEEGTGRPYIQFKLGKEWFKHASPFSWSSKDGRKVDGWNNKYTPTVNPSSRHISCLDGFAGLSHETVHGSHLSSCWL